MQTAIAQGVQASVGKLLRPLVRVLLRYGVSWGAFTEIAKRIYVDVAMESFSIPGRKPSISRASIITGLSRKEILRIKRLPPLSDQVVQNRYNRAIRVVSGWVRDEEFAQAPGRPAELPLSGGTGSFERLVRKFSGDVPVRAILDELTHSGAITRTEDGRIKLSSRAYVPGSGEEDKISILGGEVSDLVETIEHNLRHPPEQSRFQLRVGYDNLPREAVGKFRKATSRRAMRLLELLDKELSQSDRDVNPAAEGSGRMRAGLSIFFFEEELPENGGEAGS